MHYIKNIVNNRDVIYLTLGFVAIFLALYPFWIFGEYSALGWYDEYDAVIPWYYVKSHFTKLDGFMHGYAGGVGSTFGFEWANEHKSFYRYLINNNSLWVANLIFRICGFCFLFSGVYVFCRIVSKNQPQFAFAVGLLAVFVNNIPYGWTLGGLGWDIGVVAWLAVVFFAEFKNAFTRYILALILSAIATITSIFVFMVPFALYMYGLYYAAVLSFRKPYAGFYRDSLIVWCTFISLMLLNWNAVLLSIGQAKSFSARILGDLSHADVVIQSTGLLGSFLFVVKSNIKTIMLYYSHKPLLLLVFVYFGIFAVSMVRKRILKTILFVLVLILSPIFFDVIFKVINIPLFSQYRWTILWNMQPLMAAIFLSYLVKDSLKPRILKFFSLALILLSIISVYQLSMITLINLKVDGGSAVSNKYKIFNKFNSTKNKYRFISIGSIRGVVPSFYDLDTFDGMAHNFSYRRNYFVAYGLYKPSRDKLHTHRHFFRNLDDDVDFDMFKLANVRYVISDQPLPGVKFKKVSSTEAVYVKDINSYINYLNISQISRLKLLNSVFIYELNGRVWERVFVVNAIHYSQHSLRDKSLYLELKMQQYHSALVSKEDTKDIQGLIKVNPNLKIERSYLSEKGAVMHLSGNEGIVALNQVYTPFWTARCDNKAALIFPINGIMMAAYAPKGCHLLEFTYQA